MDLLEIFSEGTHEEKKPRRNLWSILQKQFVEKYPEESPRGIPKPISWEVQEEHLGNFQKELKEEFLEKSSQGIIAES